MRIRMLSVVSCLSLLLASTAPAVSKADPPMSGVYLGIGPAVAFEQFDGGGRIDIDEAWGFDVWGGYRLNEWIALEVQLEYLNGFDFRLLGTDVEGQVLNFGGNLKLFPFAGVFPSNVQPFIKAGPGVSWVEFEINGIGVDEEDFSARFGGGLDLYLNEVVAVQLSSNYLLTTGDVDDLDHVDLIVGLQFLLR